MQLSEKTKNKLKGVMPVTKEEREDALASACMQVKRVLPEFTTKFQNAYSENGFYRPIDNVEWTTGFWTGEIWLAYEYGGEDVLLKAAEIQMQDFCTGSSRRSVWIIMIWDFCIHHPVSQVIS